MEILVIALTVAFICRDPAGTLRAATAYKKAQTAQAQARGHRPPSGSRAFRRYMGTVWEHRWEEAIRRYPQRMQAAQARRSRRLAKAKAQWSKVKYRADKRWDKRFPDRARKRPTAPSTPETPPKPPVAKEEKNDNEKRPVPAGVVDLDAERQRRANPDQAPESSTAKPTTTTSTEEPMALDLSDVNSLRAHLAALGGYQSYWNEVAQAKERLAAGMADAQLGDTPIQAVDASRESYLSAGAKAELARQALEDANLAVAEARAANPDAGHGDYYKNR